MFIPKHRFKGEAAPRLLLIHLGISARRTFEGAVCIVPPTPQIKLRMLQLHLSNDLFLRYSVVIGGSCIGISLAIFELK